MTVMSRYLLCKLWKKKIDKDGNLRETWVYHTKDFPHTEKAQVGFKASAAVKWWFRCRGGHPLTNTLVVSLYYRTYTTAQSSVCRDLHPRLSMCFGRKFTGSLYSAFKHLESLVSTFVVRVVKHAQCQRLPKCLFFKDWFWNWRVSIQCNKKHP